jgi:hypothetical protein
MHRPLLGLLSCLSALALIPSNAALADTLPGNSHIPHILRYLQPPPTGPVCVPSPTGGAPTCVSPPPVPPAGQPDMVNMAYYGGHVQITPKIYLVLWGWGQKGAFKPRPPGTCPPPLRPSDPDGAGQRMISFLRAIGGTDWTGTQTQYYHTINGYPEHIQNPDHQLAGVWWDNTNPIHDNVTGLELAQEAERAAHHFNVTDLHNSQFVIAQPQNFNEAGFNSGAGYCAWHDYTKQQYYPGVMEGLSFTNMPYVINLGASCGAGSVHDNLDGVSIVLGHEVEETVTDPGAEDVIDGVNYGGWYDYTGYENGDKCAWVGVNVTGVGPSTLPVPGAVGFMTGNDGQKYPVQQLWSNSSLQGVGYCAPNGLPTVLE